GTAQIVKSAAKSYEIPTKTGDVQAEIDQALHEKLTQLQKEKLDLASRLEGQKRSFFDRFKITFFKLRYRRFDFFQVVGESMSGEVEHGEIIGVKRIQKSTRYNKGDLIVFELAGVKIVHKIEKVENVNGEIRYKTKGINNIQEDPWTVPSDKVLGKVEISQANLNKLLLWVEQGKISLDLAFGTEISSTITRTYILSEMQKILLDYYNAKVRNFDGDVKNELYGDVKKKYRPALKKLTFNPRSEKLMDSDILDAFIYFLKDRSGNEDRSNIRKTYTNMVNTIKAYAKYHKIELEDISPYPPEFNYEYIRGALVLDHINKYAGFDLMFGKQFSDEIFEKTNDKDISYVLHHFRLSIEAYIRKQSISTKDILTTQSKNHPKYDNYLSEAQAETLIESWDKLMTRGLRNWKITENDIKEIFEDVKVGKEQAVVYDKYRWKTNRMARELTDFIRAKNSNFRELDNYIKKNWVLLYERWREEYSITGLTIEEQIKTAYERVNKKYLVKQK
ncbi:MAG: signal peptidase I, partial [Promethearchaeia archaeon]